MRKIDTTQVIDPTSQQPFTVKSLEFLQNAIREAIGVNARAIIGSIYDATKVYAFTGLGQSGNIISNGYVFYNGEVYSITGADITAYSNVPVIKAAVVSDVNYDPIMFSDGVNKNVHFIDYFYIDDGVSASTTYGDYADVIFVNDIRKVTYLTPALTAFTSGSSPQFLSGSEFTGPNYSFNVEIITECDLSVPYSGDGQIGAEINIHNTTLTSNYASHIIVQDNTSTSAGKTRKYRLSGRTRLTGLTAGTQLKVRLQNTGGDSHIFSNNVVRYELFP